MRHVLLALVTLATGLALTSSAARASDLLDGVDRGRQPAPVTITRPTGFPAQQTVQAGSSLPISATQLLYENRDTRR